MSLIDNLQEEEKNILDQFDLCLLLIDTTKKNAFLTNLLNNKFYFKTEIDNKKKSGNHAVTFNLNGKITLIVQTPDLINLKLDESEFLQELKSYAFLALVIAVSSVELNEKYFNKIIEIFGKNF
jgi:hypothetical protein